jgi:threonine dehydrogenase-like Zn-dependent dehydrogenase
MEIAASRLEAARKFCADIVINSGTADPESVVARLTAG